MLDSWYQVHTAAVSGCIPSLVSAVSVPFVVANNNAGWTVCIALWVPVVDFNSSTHVIPHCPVHSAILGSSSSLQGGHGQHRIVHALKMHAQTSYHICSY